jgi:hypothetical protein
MFQYIGRAWNGVSIGTYSEAVFMDNNCRLLSDSTALLTVGFPDNGAGRTANLGERSLIAFLADPRLTLCVGDLSREEYFYVTSLQDHEYGYLADYFMEPIYRANLTGVWGPVCNIFCFFAAPDFLCCQITPNHDAKFRRIAGTDMQGDWHLVIADQFLADAGSLVKWAIEVKCKRSILQLIKKIN